MPSLLLSMHRLSQLKSQLLDKIRLVEGAHLGAQSNRLMKRTAVPLFQSQRLVNSRRVLEGSNYAEQFYQEVVEFLFFSPKANAALPRSLFIRKIV